MIRRVLKNKLVSLGYGAGFVENKMREFSITVDTSKYTESELMARVEVISYDQPTAEIPRFYLNLSGKLQDKFLFDGKIDNFAKFSTVGSQISIVDYPLSQSLCIIGITKDKKIIILVYSPSRDVSARFGDKTYEEIFGDERESEANDYYNALTAGGRIPSLKAKDILYVLMSEYVIDTILIENLNPRLRLYDNAQKFAEVITSYQYKYINRRINRIEFVEKEVKLKFAGDGVSAGFISNDPYLLLSQVNKTADFKLGKPTYAWILDDGTRQEELAIYTASDGANKPTYRELVGYKEDPALRQEMEKLIARFSHEVGYQIQRQYLMGVFKRLNKELIVLPIDFIKAHTQESMEFIEPLRYRFTIIRNRREFENILYNSIENNLNGRYKYRFVEKLSGIYLTVGNKLNYTDLEGNTIRKQSIADFNINYNAAVIKRETIIDSRSIPQLLGYIYKDLDNIGTDTLPVPSIEVVFYFPELQALGREIEMYNGTPIDLAKGDGGSAFSEIDIGTGATFVATRPKDPNEKYITVKYIDSDGNILKENIIRDVDIGSIYTPEIITNINDKEGKEWVIASNQIPNVTVTNDNAQNIIEVRYVKRTAKVRINYLNKQGAELSAPIIKNMQVGEVFDMVAAKKFTDKTGTEWNLYQSNPARFTVSEKEATNVLTLIYDVIKSDVFISYKTRQGLDIKPQEKISTVANKEFSAVVPPELVDSQGLVWTVGADSKSTIYVSETELNVIELIYDEKKARVITEFFDDEGIKIKDDVVELVQIGKIYNPVYEPALIDIYGKHWNLLGASKPEFKVMADESLNICIVSYEKVLSTIMISMINERGQRVKDDIIEKAQIGTTYTPATINEIEDVEGKVWICIDKEKTLIVSESEVSNRVSYSYKPLITRVFFQYVDDEGNELLPKKDREAQAGTYVTPEFISSLQSKDQREWELSTNNEKQFKVNIHEEENIFQIHYDKKLVDIFLSFRNVNGEKLKEEIKVQAQKGSEYNPSLYEKITSDKGERWMVTKTEPATMFVRENAHFILIYDEIKAKVVVRCINISDSKSIVNDLIITTKLGGVFVPNIGLQLFDKDKCRWKYVGEPAMNIIAKENEQENIVLLKYEPDVCNVTLKYTNEYGQIVHQDVVKPEQIGKKLAIKKYEKIIEDNGIGWTLKNISREEIIVDENPEKNIVTSNYIPLLVDVMTRYIDNDGTELTTPKVEKLQVGNAFNANILPRVTDGEGRIWTYSNIKVNEIKVKDEVNKINIKYVPLLQKVTQRFLNMQNESLVADKVIDAQVGSVYVTPEVNRVIDKEGKYWAFRKVSADRIKVQEDPNGNVIVDNYDKELIDVTVQYYTDETNYMLEKDKNLKLQIGSIYNVEYTKVLMDNQKLSWIASDDNKFEVKISPNLEENTYKISYERYMVHVYDKFINQETNEEVIKPEVSKHQVGSSYLVTVKNTIVDEEGKHWIQAASSESKLFTSSYKVDPIKVSEDETRNFTVVKYKPKLAECKIKYLDPVGNEIKPEETKKLQIGSVFGENVPTKIIDRLGNRWSFNPKSKVDVVISENPMDNNIVLAYEEAQGTVTFKYLDNVGNEIVKSTSLLAQIGSVYDPQFDMIVTDEKGCVWEYSERDREKIEVDEEDSKNIIKLTFIPLDIDVKINYIDLWGNDIIEPVMKKAQLGSHYKPLINKDFTNEDSLLYRVTKIEPEEIVIKEIPMGKTETPNEFTVTFEPINSDVIIKYKDLNGVELRDDERVHLQVGSKYTPEPPEYIKDKRGNEWKLAAWKKDPINVFEDPEHNVLTYSYEVAMADIIIRFVTVEGITIIPNTKNEMQVGQEYVPDPEPYIFDEDNKKWRLLDVKPVHLKVGNVNNIVTVTYQEAKTKVRWEFYNEAGEKIKGDERYDVQIGAHYEPQITNKVIYNENEIWRFVKTDPHAIVVSENQEENVVKLIYTNNVIDREEEEEKKELVNPFANTITEEELEQMRLSNKQNVFDATGDDSLKSSDGSVTFNLNADTVEEVEEQFEFEDPYLQGLARSMKLTNKEKITINNLNDINAQIVNLIRNSQTAYSSGSANFDYSGVEELMTKEKETIKKDLATVISNDKSGSQLLRIFENITASESDDKLLNKLQQRKAVLITDYFMDRLIDAQDKSIYICEKGKNEQSIMIINRKLASNAFKDPTEAINLKTCLYYQELMLKNYYKARNISCDEFFKDPSAKDILGPDVTVMVTNMLVNQAKNIANKDTGTLDTRIELEAILRLCTPQQIASIQEKVDGKAKKLVAQILKDIERGK